MSIDTSSIISMDTIVNCDIIYVYIRVYNMHVVQMRVCVCSCVSV